MGTDETSAVDLTEWFNNHPIVQRLAREEEERLARTGEEPKQEFRRRRFETPDQVVGANVQRLRKAAGLNQTELSELLGKTGTVIDRNRISRIENGREPVRWTQLVALAYGLGVTIFDLVLPDREDDDEDLRITIIHRGVAGVGTLTDFYSVALFGATRAVLTRERLEDAFPPAGRDVEIRRKVEEAYSRMIHNGGNDGDS